MYIYTFCTPLNHLGLSFRPLKTEDKFYMDNNQTQYK